MIGVGSTAGRFFLGSIADRVGRDAFLIAMYLGMAASLAIWAFAGAFWSLTVFALLFGVFYGGWVAILPAVVTDHFGGRNVGGIIGILYTSVAFGTLLGPSAAGFAFDINHSYARSDCDQRSRQPRRRPRRDRHDAHGLADRLSHAALIPMTVGDSTCYVRGSPPRPVRASVITRFAMTNAWSYRRADRDDIVELAAWSVPARSGSGRTSMTRARSSWCCRGRAPFASTVRPSRCLPDMPR